MLLNFMWFIPNDLGRYEILCTEYCGLRHSYMESAVKVISQVEFDKWYIELTKNKSLTNDEGKKILTNNACFGCHSIDGSKLVGPSFKNFFLAQHTVITEGKERTISATDAYLTKSIFEPNSLAENCSRTKDSNCALMSMVISFPFSVNPSAKQSAE